MPVKTKTMMHRKLFEGKVITYHLYTEKEAQELKIPYKYWKLVKFAELPCYVLDDHGTVGMLLQRRRAGIGNIFYYYSPWGNFIIAPGKMRSAQINFNKDLRRLDEDRGVLRTNHHRVLKKMYIYYLARGLSLKEIDDLFNVYGKGRKRLNEWMQTEEFNVLIKKELEEILQAAGVSKDLVVQQYMKAYEIARDKGDVKGMIESTDRLAALHMMNVKVSATVRETISHSAKDEDIARLDQAKVIDILQEKEVKSEQRTLKATSG